MTVCVGVAEEAADATIGIDERLGDYLQTDLDFVDANGDTVHLTDIVNKPTIISLVYFHCPTICKPLLSGVVDVVDRTDLEPGVDYDLWTISFDETDDAESARVIKDNFTNSLQSRIGEDDWRFLTADSTTIAALTNSAGFHFQRRENDFAHGTALIVLAPDGKIVRYLYGLDYLPFDIKMAVVEANQGKTAPSIARVLQYCFSYDPEGRRYVFNMTRVVASAGLILALGWVLYLSTAGRGRKKRKVKV